MQEISETENKLKRNELYLPKHKKENSIEMNKKKKESNNKGICSIIIPIIPFCPIILVFYFYIMFFKN